jgi:hypothetical protein
MAVNPPAGLFKTQRLPPEDWLRIVITLLFSLALIVFLGIYLYAAFAIQSDAAWTRVKEAFGVVLPALTGTLGTVIGFYFGNRKQPG